MSTKPSPDHSSSSTNSKLEEFKSKVEDGPDLGDFIAGVVPRDLHSDYEVVTLVSYTYKSVFLFLFNSGKTKT